MSITIAKATPDDAKMLLQYLKTVGGETENLTFGSEGLPFSVEEEREFIKRCENSHDEILLVAKCDGKIVGDASLSRLPRRMNHRGDLGIAVIKEFWNQGVGSLLLREIIEFAKDNDFEVIDLQVRSDNEAAIHLYKKFGFEKIGTHPAFFKVHGSYVPFDYMCLDLKK